MEKKGAFLSQPHNSLKKFTLYQILAKIEVILPIAMAN
jgi:hypothetical protein